MGSKQWWTEGGDDKESSPAIVAESTPEAPPDPESEPNATKPEEGKPEEARSEEAKPEEGKPEEGKPEEAKPAFAEVKLKPVWVENEGPTDAKPAEAKKPVWADKPAEKSKPVAKAKPADPKAAPKSPRTGPPPPPATENTPDLAVLVREKESPKVDPKRPPVAGPRPPPPRPRLSPDVVPELPPLPASPGGLKPVVLTSLVSNEEPAVAIEAPPEETGLHRSGPRWLLDRIIHLTLVVGGVRCTFEETARRSYEKRGATWPPLTNLQGMTDDSYRLVSDYVGTIETETRIRCERLEAKLRVLFATSAAGFALTCGLALTRHALFFLIAAPLVFVVVLCLRALGTHRFVTPALSPKEALSPRADLGVTILTDRLKAANANASAIDFMVDCFRVSSRLFGAGLVAVPITFLLGLRLIGPPDDVRVRVQSIEPAAASALGAVPRPPVVAEPAPAAGAHPLAASDGGASKDAAVTTSTSDAGEKLAESEAGAAPAVAPSAPTAAAPPVDPPAPVAAPVVAPAPAPKPAPAPAPAAAPAPAESAAPVTEPKPLWERP